MNIASASRSTARICLCVMMNHPFPANLPLLREMYAGRFSALRFLIPFERMDDPDVITVYRGSYNHSAYLADARVQLSGIDCDYYIVVHDDVLLNPQLSEASFHDIFAIGPDDGFIAEVQPMQPNIARNSWVLGYVSRLLFPKSMLFGSGVEADTLKRFLPNAERLREGFARAGVTATETALFDLSQPLGANTFGSEASRPLLHGISRPLPVGVAQARIETDAAAAETHLIRAMLDAQRLDRPAEIAAGDIAVPLPIPAVTSDYFTDFYILPKSGFDDFCHYAGVAGAADLFVEIIAPTLLFACCERVWTAKDLGVDLTGFDLERSLRWFEDKRNIAVHPVKLSSFRRSDKGGALIAALREIGAGQGLSRDNLLSHAAFGRTQNGFAGAAAGWHVGEDWGVWSAEPEATIPIVRAAPGTVHLVLRVPPLVGRMPTGSLRFNDGQSIALAPDPVDGDFVVTIDCLDPGSNGHATIRLINDTLARPSEIDPSSPDTRAIGFGVVRIHGSDI